MAIKSQPVVFEASDGTEFESSEDAEQYDALILARREYEDARDKFKRVLFCSQKTKDGKPFEFHKWIIMQSRCRD
jgi:hypothetical protein